MGKIIKNNVVYGGVPDEVITAWETEDVQDLSEIEYGDADISGIGDGSITGAIAEHESDISTLNSKSLGTITPASGWTLQPGSFLRKIGHLCEAYIEIAGGTYSSSGWNTVATLSEGFRPINYFDGAYLDNASGTGIVDVKFNAGGNVQVYKVSASTSTNIRLHAVYLVD